jgi:hypothetical protein
MDIPKLLLEPEIRKAFRFKSRSSLHVLLARDLELQKCVVKLPGSRRILFDEGRLAAYIKARGRAARNGGVR